MTLAEQVEAWKAMSITQLEQVINDGHEWCAAERELLEMESDGDDIRYEIMIEEIELDEMYLEVAQGIVAQKYLQRQLNTIGNGEGGMAARYYGE